MEKRVLEFNLASDADVGSNLSSSGDFEFLKKISQVKNAGYLFESVSSFSTEQLQGVHAARVDMKLSKKILSSLSVLPTLCRNLAAVDSFFTEEEKKYPRLIAYEAIRSLLIDEASQWDNREAVFVVGDDEFARVAAGAVAALGAQKILLVGDPRKLEISKAILQRFQLGIKFKIIPIDELTSQEMTGGLLINTVQLKQQKELFTALSYFNFLNPQAFVVDLVFDKRSDLLEEGVKAGVLIVENGKYAAHWAAHWWQKSQGDEKSLTPSEAFEIWQQFSTENPSSV